MSTFFTSDLHLGHRNIIDYCNRPFAGVPDMDEALVARWNATVAPGDTVYVLGDVALGKLADSLALAARLHGRKLLVPGNHDRPWEGHRKPSQHRLYEDAGFELLPSQVTIDLAGRPVLLCHFPYEGDSHGEDRYADKRPVDRGGWLLHGHVHDAWKRSGRMVNVGIDVWDYAPVSGETLIALMRDGH